MRVLKIGLLVALLAVTGCAPLEELPAPPTPSGRH
ncbi:MAG: hypothetical protein JWM80_251 [Cyanobacteria bacterium RYN_339]|nr:hypothetical protein [Cyanobacteria bacterium RYN_339]